MTAACSNPEEDRCNIRGDFVATADASAGNKEQPAKLAGANQGDGSKTKDEASLADSLKTTKDDASLADTIKLSSKSIGLEAKPTQSSLAKTRANSCTRAVAASTPRAAPATPRATPRSPTPSVSKKTTPNVKETTLTATLRGVSARVDNAEEKGTGDAAQGYLSEELVLLREANLTPDWDAIGYKLVAKLGDRYFSFWAGESLEYELGVTITEEALPNKQGGLYICQTRWAATHQKIIASDKTIRLAQRALLLCACQGPFVEYYAGKASCSSITPLGEVPVPKHDFPLGRRGQWNHLAGLTGERRVDGSQTIRALFDWDFIGYMVAAKHEDRFEALRSCAGERVTFQLGVKHEQADTLAGIDPSGFQIACLSLSVSPTPLAAVRNDASVSQAAFETGTLSMLWCACEGPVYEDPDGRLVCSKLTPLGEVNLPPAFIKEVPVRQPGQSLPGAGYLPPASRKTRSGVKTNTGNTSTLGPTTPRTSAPSPTRNGGRLRHKSPATATSLDGWRPKDGVPKPAAPQLNSSPSAAPTVALSQATVQPQRPTSAPLYRPSNRLHTVLTRWGTPEDSEIADTPKQHYQEEPPVTIAASKTDPVKPTPPATPRPLQTRQGLWVGRSVQLSGCV